MTADAQLFVGIGAILLGVAAILGAFAYYVRSNSDQNKVLAQSNSEAIAVLRTENKSLNDRLDKAIARHESAENRHALAIETARTEARLESQANLKIVDDKLTSVTAAFNISKGENNLLREQVMDFAKDKASFLTQITGLERENTDLKTQLRDQDAAYKLEILGLNNELVSVKSELSDVNKRVKVLEALNQKLEAAVAPEAA